MSDLIATSASQLEVFLQYCPRKWWFRSVRKLPEPQTRQELYGEKLHEVLERYHGADDMGCDKHGNPVELYPEGWADGISPLDAVQIKRLVGMGIESGMIYRAPDRRAEAYFDRPLNSTGDRIRGYIDLVTPEGVTDHKTRKSKRYAAGPKKLERDVQMLTYAQELRNSLAEDHRPTPDKIRIAHHYYIKEGRGSCFEVATFVIPEQLDEYSLRVEQALTDMRPLLGAVDEQWPYVEGPRPGSDACNAFGGCPYRRICSGEISVAKYRAQDLGVDPVKSTVEIDAILRREVTSVKPGTSILDLIKGKSAAPREELPVTSGGSALAGDPPREGAAIVPPAVPLDQPVPINPPQTDAAALPEPSSPPRPVRLPPWYLPGCRACQGNPFPGFSSSGRACVVCDSNALKAKPARPTSVECALFFDDDGVPSWMEGQKRVRADQLDGPSSEPVASEAAPTVSEAPKPKRGRPPGSKNKKTQEEVPSEPAPAPTPTASDSPVAGGSLSLNGGFAYFRGCRPVRQHADKVIELSELLNSLGEELTHDLGDGDQAGPNSYYEIDAFKRRDMIGTVADAIAEQLSGRIVYVPLQLTPDELSLASILRPRACFVVDAA